MIMISIKICKNTMEFLSHKKIIVDNIEEVVKKEIDNKIPLLVFPLPKVL